MTPELQMSFSSPFWPVLLPDYEILLTQAQLMNPLMNTCILFYNRSRSRKCWSIPGVCVFVGDILATDTEMALSTCCIVYIMPAR